LGRSVAQLLRGDDLTRPTGNKALGRELADHAIEVGAGFKLEHAARRRRDPGVAARASGARWHDRPIKMRDTHKRDLVELREVPHLESAPIVRRFLALLCCLFEQAALSGDNRGRAAGVGVFLGRTRMKQRGTADAWVYVPKERQSGIAARLGVDVRTLEQMIAVLVHGRILRAWQPPAYDRTTGVALPPGLRGETYAYQMYTLVGGLPDALAGHLRRWDGMSQQRAAEASPARVDGAELGGGGDGEPAAASFDAAAADEAFRRVTGHDPPTPS
jgi:hypothetical protein